MEYILLSPLLLNCCYNTDRDGQTALHMTALSDYDLAEKTTYLLSKGADPNARDFSKYVPLHAAAIRGRNEMVKELIAGKADVNIKGGWTQRTPLHDAASMGAVEVVKLLLDAGATVDEKSANGNTPLHEAAGAGEADVIQMLLDAGADGNAKNNDEDWPWHLAMDSLVDDPDGVAALLPIPPPDDEDADTSRGRSRSGSVGRKRGKSRAKSAAAAAAVKNDESAPLVPPEPSNE